MGSDRYSRHLLLEHYGKPGSFDEDFYRISTLDFASLSYNSPIFPPISTHSGLLSMVLCMQVSSRSQSAFARQHVLEQKTDSSFRFVPSEWRPTISVKVLPALENILYGANLSNILSAHQNTVLDLLAWFPYGLGHFGAPVVCAGIMFLFAPPTTIRYFGYAFGWMNIIGVTTQVLFPCSSPWYENMYGLAPANYSMKGSPAGLARIDALLGIDLYTSGFTASPMVFGAFPSLHAADATLEALFMSHCFPKLTPLFVTYALWLWWATMYLSHHYAVDLVGGSLLAAVIFFFTKSHFLPRIQPDKKFRWDYDYIECGDAPSEYAYGIAGLDGAHPDSDEWTVGSTSSVSSGSLSPVDENQQVWADVYHSSR